MEKKKQTKEEMEKSKTELLNQLSQMNVSTDNMDWVKENLNKMIDDEVKNQNDNSN